MLIVKPENVAQYIAGFPKETQDILQQVRSTIKKAAPRAEETISYAIPCFKMEGHPLMYFAGYKTHISIYPAPRGDEAFKDELAQYKGGKGTVQFPLNKPIPHGLIKRIASFRIKQWQEKKSQKAVKKQ